MIVISFLKNMLTNFTYMVNPRKSKRDNTVVIFGAWFGNRFADNSRFLYQWLSKNKNDLQLTHVVWITENVQVYNELKSLGYEVYMKSSLESIYYHRIAGIHFICQSPSKDIFSKYSNGAIKINLWHGIGGIKGVDFASNDYNNRQFIFKIKKFILRHTLLRRLFMQSGGWGNCLYLSTTSYETSILRQYFARRDECFIESDYPRNCECIELMLSERKVVGYLSTWDTYILYLPTFRENADYYVDPLSNDRLKDFLYKNNILWVEKQHSYSKNDFDEVHEDNIFKLDPEFDISVIIKKATLVITDYSSVCWDALYNDIPVIFYTPDFDYYVNNDRGLVMKPEEFLFGPRADTSEQLLDVLEANNGKFGEMLSDNKKEIFEKMWGTKKGYAEIWQDITSFIKSHPKGGV